MNLLRPSIAWQMIVPIPLTVIATIAAATNAAGQAILASRNMAAQVIAIRKYYTDNVVDKVVRMLHGELRGDQISVQTELANALPNVYEFDHRPGSGAANKLREVRAIRRADRSGGLRNRHPAGKYRSRLRPFLHHQNSRNGGAAIDLPIDRRKPWGATRGITARHLWHDISAAEAED
jgi:hypothetical protein